MNIKFTSDLAMSNFAALPDEIVRDVLTELPAKSVGQSRCVSRPWRDLLSNPDFIRTHLSRHINDQEQLLLLSRSHSLFTITFTPGNPGCDGVLTKLNLSGCQDNWVTVVGSCYGLALVVNEEEGKYLVNPITCEHVKLPNLPVPLDPHISLSMHGFGYDTVNNDYKIVTLSYYDPDNDCSPDCADTFVDVYSAKMGSWRRLGTSPYDHGTPDNDSGVFLNGALHWMASHAIDFSPVIVAFNLASEKFGELPIPTNVNKDRFVFNKLVVLGGYLCVVDDHLRDRLEVWVMKEYGLGESWAKFIINAPEYLDAKPLCPLGDGQTMVIVDGENLMMHNLKEKTSRKLVIDSTPPGFEDGVPFRGSLISPNFNSWNEAQPSSWIGN